MYVHNKNHGPFWSLSVFRGRSLLKVCELAVVCARSETRTPPTPSQRKKDILSSYFCQKSPSTLPQDIKKG